MSNKLLLLFAQSLKKQREAKGFTLQQVAAQTRIDIKFLASIETGEFDIMPEVYIRAFIKDYANVIELDVFETLEKYDAAKTGKLVQDAEFETENKTAAKTAEKTTREFVSSETGEKPIVNNQLPPNSNVILIFISIGIVVLLGIYFLFIKPSDNTIIKEKPFNQVLTGKQRFKTGPVEPEKTIQPNSDESIQKKEPFSLTLLSNDTVWIRLRIDNKIDKEFTLTQNEKETISANDSINLLVGNLGGIKFLLNNKNYDFKGYEGQVQNFIVTRNSIRKVKFNQVKADE